MITENEVIATIIGILGEWRREEVSGNIMIRDIRSCIRRFDGQPTEYSTSETVDLATLADGTA